MHEQYLAIKLRASLFQIGTLEGDYFLTEFYLICRVFLLLTLTCCAAP